MSHFTFLAPLWIGGALLVLLAARLLGRKRPTNALAHPWARWLVGLPRSPRQRLLPWLARTRRAALLLLGAALAEPSAIWTQEREERRGVDLLVSLDASSSMTFTVPGPFATTRFSAARAAIHSFVAGRPHDRVGLVTFARYPRLCCPLTTDHVLFDALLEQAVPVTAGGEEDRTAIGVALADGANRVGAGLGRTRVLVLVTDGVNNLGPITPEDGARLCLEAGIRVYTIALGGAELFGSGVPPLDTKLLDQVAQVTGGRSFSVHDRPGLEDAWHTIDGLEQAPLEVKSEARAVPVSGALVAALFFALVVLVGWERGIGGALA